MITGGPGSGKTSIIDALEADGYRCYHEIIRTFTQEAKADNSRGEHRNNPIAFVDDSLEFNRKLLEGRLSQFLDSRTAPESLVFFDRGMPDVLAYMEYFNQRVPEDFLAICKTHRYDRIIILPPWKAIYNTDDERFENWEVAFEIFEYLKTTYTNLGYAVEEVPKGTVTERKEYIEALMRPKPRK